MSCYPFMWEPSFTLQPPYKLQPSLYIAPIPRGRVLQLPEWRVGAFQLFLNTTGWLEMGLLPSSIQISQPSPLLPCSEDDSVNFTAGQRKGVLTSLDGVHGKWWRHRQLNCTVADVHTDILLIPGLDQSPPFSDACSIHSYKNNLGSTGVTTLS